MDEMSSSLPDTLTSAATYAIPLIIDFAPLRVTVSGAPFISPTTYPFLGLPEVMILTSFFSFTIWSAVTVMAGGFCSTISMEAIYNDAKIQEKSHSFHFQWRIITTNTIIMQNKRNGYRSFVHIKSHNHRSVFIDVKHHS